MRSVIAFAALALTSSLNLTAAGPCRPKSRTTSSQSESLTFTDATGTLSASATTTETGGDIIITNAARNGRFAIADPDSESGISATSTPRARPNNTRVAASKKMEVMMMVVCRSRRQVAHQATTSELRFYYAVLTGSGSNMCSINAYLGSQQFYSSTIFTNGPTASWNQVLETVVAESTSAAFRIAMSCSGNGFAMIYVDSVFISNQVTPANINDFILNFGDSQSNNPQSTTASIAPVETSSSTEWPLTATEFPSTDRTSQPETRTIEPATESQTDSTPEPGTFTPGPSTETEGVETWTSTSGPRTETEDPEQQTSGSLTQAASEDQ
ncbi:hypothetical protein NM208_g4704 [Fusarium decemcellulare]|uniref:Uncharacterized protein n=1 Tax=Fusarium decemcellulare TaxID=57161 RepID=A0ACC1SJV7_9HYPO|nr:hypothetical protein NM208_g4704 [Fusarium decemcellulare]